MVNGGSGPIPSNQYPDDTITPDNKDLKLSGRDAWTSLHTMQAPTADKLTAWLDTVPSYSCKCREFATQYIKDNPPPYDDQAAFFEWGWRFHDAVDQKTGDQRMTLEEARAFWNDERTRQAALPVPSLSGGHPTIASVDTPPA
jgi:hypothetical protein